MAYDRITAADRAVAAYQRFSETNYNDTPEELMVGLFHWVSIYTDRGATDEDLMAMATRALERFRSPHDRTEAEEYGDDEPSFVDVPLPRIDRAEVMTASTMRATYTPNAEVPLPGGPTVAFPSRQTLQMGADFWRQFPTEYRETGVPEEPNEDAEDIPFP